MSSRIYPIVIFIGVLLLVAATSLLRSDGNNSVTPVSGRAGTRHGCGPLKRVQLR